MACGENHDRMFHESAQAFGPWTCIGSNLEVFLLKYKIMVVSNVSPQEKAHTKD